MDKPTEGLAIACVTFKITALCKTLSASQIIFNLVILKIQLILKKNLYITLTIFQKGENIFAGIQGKRIVAKKTPQLSDQLQLTNILFALKRLWGSPRLLRVAVMLMMEAEVFISCGKQFLCGGCSVQQECFFSLWNSQNRSGQYRSGMQ